MSRENQRAMNTVLVPKCKLEEEDFVQIRALAEACRLADSIEVKFNWGMMQERDSAGFNDFCCYADGLLVGYVPLDGFGDEFEITSAVLPAYRRQGIFRRLFEAARQEARRRQAKKLLLVGYRDSVAGNEVIRRLDIPYDFSEYHMEAEAAAIGSLPTSRIQLELVNETNVADLSRMLALSFEDARWNAPEELRKELQREDKRYFLAKLDETPIGQIGVITEENEVYIRAVGIVPEWRGRGYGRQLLATTILMLLQEGHTQFSLDVATNNGNALSLYQSCGFHAVNVYDYYVVPRM